jgi:ribosomal-protein-alanine N-acetyltransferase
MAMAIHIDQVRHDDLPTIAEIERRSFSDPWSERAFSDLLSHPHIFFACARRGKEAEPGRVGGSASAPVGYVVAWFASGAGEIANLAVAPDERGQGIGSLLLDAALAQARRAGTTETYLEVRNSNLRARQLYDSRGFVEVGRRRNYYRRPVEDAVILRWAASVATPNVNSEV